jgi:HTH-type transcriptional regulator/antitoxin HipB
MNFPVSTSQQLKAVLRALRRARGLSQAEIGSRLGVNQKRIARIESAPGVTGYDQISRLVSTLGARLVIEENTDIAPTSAKSTKTTQRKGVKGTW